MTMTLELPDELEARLKADARARGVAPETAVVEAVNARYGETKEQRRARIKAAIDEAQSHFAQFPPVGDFLEEKRADVARENARGYGDFGDEKEIDAERNS